MHKEAIDNVCSRERCQTVLDDAHHNYEAAMQENEQLRKKNHEKALVMAEKLIPELSKFTTTFRKSDNISNYNVPGPMDILKLEGIKEIKLHDGKVMNVF